MNDYTRPLDSLSMQDVPIVGGKNASLGEMLQNLNQSGVAVPGGFATTAHAYREFLNYENLASRINQCLDKVDVDNVTALQSAGKSIRGWIMEVPFPPDMEAAIESDYQQLEQAYGDPVSWAVRSSATAEDMPDASFAGQQETYLNVQGIDAIKLAIRNVFASLFNDRAIAYREHQGYAHQNVALSAGIQKMIRSDLATSGVMFTLDTESGFEDVVFITASYGLGEMVVQGAVNPDEFFVHKAALRAGNNAVVKRSLGSKQQQMTYDASGEALVKIIDVEVEQQLRFCLSQNEVESLARIALVIEHHYQRPMDIEWAKDGVDGNLYIVQARPETVVSRQSNLIEKYTLEEKSEVVTEGRAIGNRIGSGKVRLIVNLSDMDTFQAGDVLLTDMTDPDWEPIMKKSSAIITNRGGRTCHAAIIARELGVPAVVGCGDATERVTDNEPVTVCCAGGDTGSVYTGKLLFKHEKCAMDAMPELPVKIMMNVGNPERAFDFAHIPNAGVGLARMEFIINNMIGIHPKALLAVNTLDDDLQREIYQRTIAYDDPVNFYVKRIAEGVATIAAAFNNKPVIVRMSDFKSNEYANLLGGSLYEPHEENPMIGYRGAARYTSENFRDCFELECQAIRYVREEMGFSNVELMIPFVRTLQEASQVIQILAENGLKRGDNGLRIIMMCELPSNAILADRFLEYFDGFSIGSNDMTQLTLGLDRDSSLVADSFDERDPAVLEMLKLAIKSCKDKNKYIGICGQGPSDYEDFAAWLLEQGIGSISLNPDTVVNTWLKLAQLKASH